VARIGGLRAALLASGAVLLLGLGGCGAECLRDSDCDTAFACLAGHCVAGSGGGRDGGTTPSPSGGAGAGLGGSAGMGGGAGEGGSAGAAGSAGEGGSAGADGSGSGGVGGSAGSDGLGGSGGTTSTGTVNNPDAGLDGSVSADAQ
jgi:hypothetical protein